MKEIFWARVVDLVLVEQHTWLIRELLVWVNLIIDEGTQQIHFFELSNILQIKNKKAKLFLLLPKSIYKQNKFYFCLKIPKRKVWHIDIYTTAKIIILGWWGGRRDIKLGPMKSIEDKKR